MQEIVKTLKSNAKEVQFGTVGVELRIHEGKVVRVIYKTEKTKVQRTHEKPMEENNG